ncbi:hypothetical protein ACBJ59_24150 [Nonomuraea sp. MTCD27]|uniref:hypothetical protein n=1 Tax=Nonomuraea sp. MTCD27 TaxID=1676747 RepID=UPI0035C00785
MAAAVGLLVVAGCSAGGGETVGAAPRAGPSDLPPQVTAGEARVLWDAEQLLVRDCMARRGFRYWVVPRDSIPENRDFPYVVDDLGWARRHGYGGDILERIDRLRDRNPNRRYLEGLPAQRRRAAFAALYGEGPQSWAATPRPDQLEARLPTGGVVRRNAASCTSEAPGLLYGDLATWFRATRVVQNLADLRRARVVRDPRFAAAVGAWSRCMRGRGHPYAHPRLTRAEAVADGSAGPAARKAREKQIATAVAEAICAGESGLSAVARELDEKYARELVARHRPDVIAERRMRRDALPMALRITAAGGGHAPSSTPGVVRATP